MKGKLLFSVAMLLLTATAARSQEGYNERARKYVAQYYPMAMGEQKRSGIPAAITLAQGILETEAGASELMVEANNHFGIKCKNDWQGETFTHTDDAPDECFKKYKSAEESFADHSLHLKRNPRYNPLFSIPVENYTGWANGLKKCGYATNPQYGQRLAKIVEEFRLQEYTLAALNNKEIAIPVEEPTAIAKTSAEPVIRESTGIAEPVQAKYIMPAPAKAVAAVAKDTVKKAEPAAVTAAVVTPAPVPHIAFVQRPGSKIIVHSGGDDTTKAAEVSDSLFEDYDEEATTSIKKIADSARSFIMRETQNTYYAAAPPVDSSKVVTINGLKAFPAKKGESLLKYAVQYKVRYPLLLEMNDLSDAPLPFDCYVYLQRKLATGAHDKHTMKDGENLLMVAQAEGIQLKKLMLLNHLNPKDEPVAGAVLDLQNPAAEKPAVKVAVIAAHKGNAITTEDSGKGNYITLRKPGAKIQPADTVKAPAKTAIAAATKTKPENRIKVAITKAKTPDTLKAAPTTNPDNVVATSVVTTEPIDTAEPTGPYIVYLSGDKTDVLTNKSMQWMAQDAEKPKPAPKNANPGIAALASLKSELDKVVYADNTRLLAARPEAPRAAARYYTVKKGETATAIARKNNITLSELLKWNHISADEIKAGQDLKISE
ncbi:MAG: glucosaminidase domain-containing protein [Bacteroidota bacterium]